MALIQCNFFSEALGECTTIDVILPQPVAGKPARATRYPVLWLLHGLSDDHTIWQRRTSIERYVEPMNLAVVMPAVGRSFYTDMARGQKYWTFVSEELPSVARHFFPLSTRREENFVAGPVHGRLRRLQAGVDLSQSLRGSGQPVGRPAPFLRRS